MLTTKEKQILDALENYSQNTDIEIITVEIVGGTKSPNIRVYLDAPGGVSFDRLASSQSWASKVLDHIDPFPGAYTLEVSSPGIDRPLRTFEHFSNAVGEDVFLTTVKAVNGRKKHNAKLLSATKELLEICCDDQTYSVNLSDIKKANVKGKLAF